MIFFFESELYKTNELKQTLKILEKEGLIYEDYIDDPKNEAYVKDSKAKHLLFKATKFGNTEDRAITKGDGSHSYFGSELAYINNKISRNFDFYFTILGADHF